jgi:hypothetical protein
VRSHRLTPLLDDLLRDAEAAQAARAVAAQLAGQNGALRAAQVLTRYLT